MIGMVKGTTRQMKQVAGLPAPIASFRTNMSGNINSLKVLVEAVQSGSGTPSPDNPRPITGWSGANVTRTGKNLFNGTLEQGTFSTSTGEMINSTTRVRATANIPLPSGNYTLRNSNGYQFVLYVYDLEGNFKQSDSHISWKDNPLSFNLVANRQINFAIRNDTNTTIVPSDVVGLCLYDRTLGNTYTIAFGDTYYGGELDVTNGVLRVTHGKVKISDLSWNRNAQYNVYYAYINGKAVDYDNFLCDSYNVVRKSFQTLNNGEISGTNVNNGINIKDDSFSDAQTFAQSRGNVEIVYELATPIEIQLTPTQIAQLLGDNNVFADCGDVSELKHLNRIDTVLFSKG